MNHKRTIHASPTKDFFINMITRDIDLKNAILELVDNSIDGATRLRPNGDFNGLWVKIDISDSTFGISDNCGGIPVDIAEEYAFRFGRPKKASNKTDFSTGVFGIGMKRALFKLGKCFTIESTTPNSYFKLNMNVDEWAKNDEDWNFSFDSVDESCTNNIENTGTKITIYNLNEGIKDDFKLDFFKQQLIEHIQNHVTLSIEKGLKIEINGVRLNPIVHEIFMSRDLQPAYEEYSLNNVKIKILAGMGIKGDPDKAGWYIYCNGRLILQADKTKITGWEEDNSPKFHPTYARFRGFVFFESKDPNLLPWTTTKTGIDTSSPIFINAKVKMKNIFKSIKNVLTKIKNIKDDSEREDIEEYINSLPQVKISPLSLTTIDTAKLSNKIHATFLDDSQRYYDSNVTISYKKPKKYVDKIKEHLGVMSNKEVGERTFDYFLELEGLDGDQ